MAETITDPNRIVRPREATQYVPFTVGTLANMRVKRTGPRFIRAGGSIGYRIADLIEWANAHTVETTDQA